MSFNAEWHDQGQGDLHERRDEDRDGRCEESRSEGRSDAGAERRREELLLILRMVRDGRLTPDEAEWLLAALEGAGRGREEPGGDGREDGEGQRRGTEREEGAGGADARAEGERRRGGSLPDLEDVEAWIERLGERLGERWEGVRERVEEALHTARARAEERVNASRDDVDRAWDALQRGIAQVLSELPQRLSRASSSFLRMEWDPHRNRAVHTVERELAVPAIAENARWAARVRNGSIVVYGTEGAPAVKVRLHVRADDPSAASARADELLRVDGDEAGWNLETKEERGERVEVTIALPRRPRVSLALSSVNGRLACRDVSLSEVTLRTENGDVDVERMQADRVDIETVNGRVVVEGLVGDTLTARATNGDVRVQAAVRSAECRSVNGSVEVEPIVPEAPERKADERGGEPSSGVARSYVVETINGRVRVIAPSRGTIGYRFDLHAVEGKISLALDDVSRVVNETGRPDGGIRAESSGYADRPERVDVLVRTRRGAIDVEGTTG